jgi:hypothetical protein
MPGWHAGRSETRLGVTFGVDAPAKEHDFYDLSFGGPVAGGKARVSSFVFDFKEVDYPSSSYAFLSIVPESLISKATIERSLGTQLVPNGAVIENPGVTTIIEQGKEPITTEPYTRWMQHYTASSTSENSVSITAKRMWGEIGNQQSWFISCGTYTPPIRP